MKLDMHCHTAEGSTDSKVGIKEYIYKLKSLGYEGMVVTDHDSYGGYRWYESHKDEMPEDFVVIKGIEYDTYEAGHFIVIMPDGVDLEILECRGLELCKLTEIVHMYGGIIGPAHPCGEPFLSVFSTGKYRRDKSIMEDIDFLEGFNCGEDAWANDEALELAKQFDKPVTGGSDAHWYACIGLAYTELNEKVRNNNELIEYMKANKPTKIWGQPYGGTLKARLGRLNKLLVYGFFPYNKYEAFKMRSKRIRLYASMNRKNQKLLHQEKSGRIY